MGALEDARQAAQTRSCRPSGWPRIAGRLQHARRHDAVDARRSEPDARRARDPARRRRRGEAAPDATAGHGHCRRGRAMPRSRTPSRRSSPRTWRPSRATLPGVRDFAVWNEPNLNGFWLYQFDDRARTSLRARTPRSSPAPTTSSRRSRRRSSSSAVRWRRAGRTTRRHRGTRSLRRPSSARWAARTEPAVGRSRSWTSSRSIRTSSAPHSRRARQHPRGTSIGIADYDKLVALLGEAFDGTAQPGSKLPIAYTEFGVQAKIPERRPGAVHEPRLPTRPGRGRRGDPGALLPRGARARRVPADGHRASLLPPDRRARPEPLAVRALLRGPAAEVEPPGRSREASLKARKGEPRHLFVRFMS